MTIAKTKGKLKGGAPKRSETRQAHLLKLHAAGEHTNAELSWPPATGSSNAAPQPRAPSVTQLSTAPVQPIPTITDVLLLLEGHGPAYP